MNYFLAKTDPETYSIENLARDGETVWSGVRNPQAVIVLKSMKKNDLVLIYHSQGEGTIRGLAKVIGNGRADTGDAKSWLVDFKFIKNFSEPYITIKDVKASGLFTDFALVRQSRLSTMKVPQNFISWLKQKGLKI